MTLYSTNHSHFASTSIPTPSLGGVATYSQYHSSISNYDVSPTLSTTSSEESLSDRDRIPRPKLGSRKSSGSMIISRDTQVELRPEDEEYDENDVRTMSPRRSSEVTEKIGEHARQHLIEYVMPRFLCHPIDRTSH